jgi:predicted  nucleic acid-binding Zn-ribbon protein
MISFEEATTNLAVANEQFIVAEAAWKVENAELHQEYETLKTELTQLLSQRKQLVRAIDAKDMSEYDSLRRLRKGIAVVAAQHGRCSACNVAIPKRDLERATQADEIMHCSGCDRILYAPSE